MQQRARELAKRLQVVHGKANDIDATERNSVTQGISNHVPHCISTGTDLQSHSQQLPVTPRIADGESNAVAGKYDAIPRNNSSADGCASSLSTLLPKPTDKEMESPSCADHLASVERDSGTSLPPDIDTHTSSSSLEQNIHPMKQDHGQQTVPMKELLLHAPEMNLPWTPLRGVTQCACGVPFTFTKRKVRGKLPGSLYLFRSS